jgi:hypothetical protein
MGTSIRLTSEDVKKILRSVHTWKRYRGPFGTVRAAELKDDIEITASEGVVAGKRSDYLVIDDTTFDCWTEPKGLFERQYYSLEPA